MFHNLRYSVTFPTTGRTLSNNLDFSEGFAAISGPNESGKSMILEMLRFLLFGSQALRGEAADYKTLKAEGEVTIRGDRYRIVRTMKKADLYRDGEIIATGVSVVNDKIGRILGFGRAVFDIACSINQGEVERLGSMTSTDRKRLVDSVLGIDALDVVAKWGMEEARLLERDAATLRQHLVPPVPPPSVTVGAPATVKPVLDQLEGEATELATLTGWLAQDRPKPSKPTCSVSLPAAALAQFAAKRVELRHRVEELKAKIRPLPEKAPYAAGVVDAVEELWADYEVYLQDQEWFRKNPRPQWWPHQLSIFVDDWKALANTREFRRLDCQILDLEAKGSKPCPHCDEEILLEHDTIEQLKATRDALEVPYEGFVIEPPPIAAHLIAGELQRANEYDWERAPMDPVPTPALTRKEIAQARQQIVEAAERAALQAELDLKQPEFDVMPDYEAWLAERKAFETAEKVYATEKMAYDFWVNEKQAKQVRADALRHVPHQLVQVRVEYQAALAHERAVLAFEQAQTQYLARLAEADEKEASAAEHRKVRDVMNVLRSLIKQHILPSLNKVASHLITGMTGGQRNIVEVDEDFNVLVDKQDIQTLSGSGKSVANLALRIALGQVLTNRVISVLLADEIDASMDEFRAEKTSLVLYTLETSISQILLVSHKSVSADNHVELGELSGTQPT